MRSVFWRTDWRRISMPSAGSRNTVDRSRPISLSTSSLSNIHHEDPGGCGVSFLILPFQGRGRGGEQLHSRDAPRRSDLTRPMSNPTTHSCLHFNLTNFTNAHITDNSSPSPQNFGHRCLRIRLRACSSCRIRGSCK